MIEAKSYAVVLGCGERGAAWVAQNKDPDQTAIGLDIKRPRQTNEPLVIGDVFSLPIRNNSINKIHADFIVNGLTDREIAAPQILENPDVLDTNYFPPLVRQWFVVSMNRSHDSVRRNIKEVSTLLKTVAMREIWRILANNGNLELLDFEYNINWIAHYAPQIVQEDPTCLKLEPLRISQEDFVRSSSLEKVVKGSTYVQKIKLTKLPRQIG